MDLAVVSLNMLDDVSPSLDMFESISGSSFYSSWGSANENVFNLFLNGRKLFGSFDRFATYEDLVLNAFLSCGGRMFPLPVNMAVAFVCIGSDDSESDDLYTASTDCR